MANAATFHWQGLDLPLPDVIAQLGRPLNEAETQAIKEALQDYEAGDDTGLCFHLSGRRLALLEQAVGHSFPDWGYVTSWALAWAAKQGWAGEVGPHFESDYRAAWCRYILASSEALEKANAQP